MADPQVVAQLSGEEDRIGRGLLGHVRANPCQSQA